MNNSTKQILIIAGEASGDHHAARLVEELHKHDSDVHFAGIGGERMRKAGVEILVDSADMAVVGLVEVLANYRFLKGVLERMRRELRERRPDMLILVDYPDFNLRLAKTAKELGIKVLYYISPQVWAWRQKRVYKIKELVDMMAVVFPFEAPFYEQAEVPVRFVGHPLVDEVGSDLTKEQAQQAFGLDPNHPVILPRASTLSDAFLAPYLADSKLDVTVVPGRAYDVMRSCDTIISASGTATLEIGLMQVPLVVIYKIAPLSYQIMSRLIKVDHIALCNIVAGERVAPELIQHDATPEKISAEALKLLTDSEKAEHMKQRQTKIREKLGGSGGSANVAELALELLSNEKKQ
jgi:lipid-A-disaccharide synthase